MKKLFFSLTIVVFLCNTIIGQNNNTLVSDDGDVVKLNNGVLKLSFKRGSQFNLFNISSVANEESWVTTLGMRNAVWVLKIQDNNGVVVTINSSSNECTYKGFNVDDNGEIANVKHHWEVNLANNPPFSVFATISMSNNSALSEWWFDAVLPIGYKVVNLTYPRITFLKTNNVSKLVLPMGVGAEYEIPTKATTYNAPYPSSRATVQLMCMHNGGEALYFATHDVDANAKSFNVNTNATNAASLFLETEASLDWTKSDGKFNLPWKTSIGIHPEGWIKAVKDWYKPFSYNTDWGKNKIQERNIPNWVLQKNFWITTNSAEGVESLIDRALKYFGPEQTGDQAYYWHNYPFDTYYPEYFPAKPNFITSKNVTQGLGSHVIPYINGRLWDSTTDYFTQQNARNSAIMNKDGSIVTESYASTPSAVMCPSTDLWENTLLDITTKLFNELNVDGIYYDQIASARPFSCWNPEHNHSMGGGSFWVKSYREMMQNIKRAWSGEKAFSTEQNAECFLDLFEIMCLTNRPRYSNYTQVPLFQYIYSDRAILSGLNVFNSSNISLIYKNTLSLLWGTQVGGVQVDLLMNRILVDYRNFLRTLANFRGQNSDVFLGGELLAEFIPEGDNPIVSIPDYGDSNVVRGVKWKTINNEEVVILVNFDSKSHEILVNGSTVSIDRYSCLRINLTTSGVDNGVDKSSENIVVFSQGDNIYISGASKQDQFLIYNVAGQLIAKGRIDGNGEAVATINSSGIHIVTVLTRENRQTTYKVALL